jgi:hypothetical protein
MVNNAVIAMNVAKKQPKRSVANLLNTTNCFALQVCNGAEKQNPVRVVAIKKHVAYRGKL